MRGRRSPTTMPTARLLHSSRRHAHLVQQKRSDRARHCGLMRRERRRPERWSAKWTPATSIQTLNRTSPHWCQRRTPGPGRHPQPSAAVVSSCLQQTHPRMRNTVRPQIARSGGGRQSSRRNRRPSVRGAPYSARNKGQRQQQQRQPGSRGAKSRWWRR